MKVKELIKILEKSDPENEVSISVNTPGGFICPDGAMIGIKTACSRGIDWHGHEAILIPEYSLDVHDIDAWASRKNEN